MRKFLHLGGGHYPVRRLKFNPIEERRGGEEVVEVNLDIIPTADVVFDLNQLHYGNKLPFEDEEFDEIHAYEVLEHIGRFGDWKGFFMEFNEYWRILKMGGMMFGSYPIGETRWCDPGHSRVFSTVLLSHVCQGSILEDRAKPYTSRTDYSSVWPDDRSLSIIWHDTNKEKTSELFILQKQPVADIMKLIEAKNAAAGSGAAIEGS